MGEVESDMPTARYANAFLHKLLVVLSTATTSGLTHDEPIISCPIATVV
ncbi:hypothetical protein MiSe_40480 [Microseira wollei NIES-4236]|uniref:Uncharacterized protein n=1 Tax=Microseira wollei NIES-4236 TaxID=2530354 RepID=A0AAV3XFS6_9CYAN|nr:hypothetical protein MiSe_40480 [Microseira wollei NIES-4236]